MHRFLDWPFIDGQFPRSLAAVVQRSVLEGEEPARLVVHTAGNDWAVGDGVNDPNLPGASVATHMWDVMSRTHRSVRSRTCHWVGRPAGRALTNPG